ncbi:MAG: tetratricopeptide repeat protein [Ignavibacteriaceae bacterium]
MKITRLVIFAVFILTFIVNQNILGCSLIKITINGKTIVGNNEDFGNHDTRIWFEPGDNQHYGVVYVGYDDLFPEGGMNEAGLVFDAFGVSNKPLKDTLGKEPIFELDLKRKIMTECATAEEVMALINKYNLYYWSHSVWVFLDKNGKYLIVDGDSKVLGDNSYFVQTNFRQSEVVDESRIDCSRYKKAMSLLEGHNETSIEYCTSVMDSVHQNSTLYTTVYDLNNAIIYLYYFHNYKKAIRFDLKEELKKGARILVIPELFPEEKTNDYIQSRVLKSRIDSLANISPAVDSVTKKELRERWYIPHIIANHGYGYLHRKDIPNAIAIFNLFIELFPQLPYGYDFLGEAYMEEKQYQLALTNYQKSIELDPNYINGKQRIDVLKKLIEKRE